MGVFRGLLGHPSPVEVKEFVQINVTLCYNVEVVNTFENVHPKCSPWSPPFGILNMPLRQCVHRCKLWARLELFQEIVVHQTQPCREAIVTETLTILVNGQNDGAALFWSMFSCVAVCKIPGDSAELR